MSKFKSITQQCPVKKCGGHGIRIGKTVLSAEHAWMRCSVCGHKWSARVKAPKPDPSREVTRV